MYIPKKIPKVLTVVHCEGQHLIESKLAAIPPILAAMDGISITTFKGDKGIYYEINDIIAWHEKEVQFLRNEEVRTEYLKLIESMKRRRDSLKQK